MAFVPNRPLLNPQFEGYKLSFTPSPQIVSVPLEHKATQTRSGTRVLGFQEVSSRVRHNHLAVGENADCAVYIADDRSVVLVSADENLNGDEEQDGVDLRVVFHLPAPLTVSSAQPEYPAAAHVERDIWLISDGNGTAYLLRMNRASPGGEATAELLATWQFLTDVGPTSFQLHSVGLVEPGCALAVLSSTAHSAEASSTKKSETVFDIRAVRVPIPEAPSQPAPLQETQVGVFETLWRRRGTHIPLFVKFVPGHGAFLLLGGSSYRDVDSPVILTPPEPKPDELAPVPRLGESLDTPAPPPYSWTQTDDTVTVAFAIPGMTPKTSISAVFRAHTLSLNVAVPKILQPHYDAAPLWDAVHPESSLWTWERGDLNKAGLLTLHLDKVNTGTRWSHVFAQGFENDVAETLDPSQLAEIRESLDKYTAALQDGTGGLGHGVPSLAEGERDAEVDSNIGNPIVVTWVDADGSARTPPDDTPAVLLSLPLPGISDPVTLVVKNDIDGLLYKLDGARKWTHAATYPALAFVLASKRDTRFTFHVSSTVTLAFESGAREGGGGNVYIYRGSVSGDKWAKQSVFQLPAGAGALLGIGVITSKAGHVDLLCLSERELTVCRGLS